MCKRKTKGDVPYVLSHFFYNAFRSEPIEDDHYFITAMIYIYQNPDVIFFTGSRFPQ